MQNNRTATIFSQVVVKTLFLFVVIIVSNELGKINADLINGINQWNLYPWIFLLTKKVTHYFRNYAILRGSCIRGGTLSFFTFQKKKGSNWLYLRIRVV